MGMLISIPISVECLLPTVSKYPLNIIKNIWLQNLSPAREGPSFYSNLGEFTLEAMYMCLLLPLGKVCHNVYAITLRGDQRRCDMHHELLTQRALFCIAVNV